MAWQAGRSRRRLRVRRVPIAGSRKPEIPHRAESSISAHESAGQHADASRRPRSVAVVAPSIKRGREARRSVAQRVAHVRVRCRATVRDSHAGGFSRSGLRRPCAALRVRRMSPDPWTHFTFRSRRGKPESLFEKTLRDPAQYPRRRSLDGRRAFLLLGHGGRRARARVHLERLRDAGVAQCGRRSDPARPRAGKPHLRPHLRPRRFGLHLARNVVHFAATYAWTLGVTLLPLATVFALEFTDPAWVALLAVRSCPRRMDAAAWSPSSSASSASRHPAARARHASAGEFHRARSGVRLCADGRRDQEAASLDREHVSRSCSS